MVTRFTGGHRISEGEHSAILLIISAIPICPEVSPFLVVLTHLRDPFPLIYYSTHLLAWLGLELLHLTYSIIPILYLMRYYLHPFFETRRNATLELPFCKITSPSPASSALLVVLAALEGDSRAVA
jgi:hypothetical protein